MYKGLKQQFIEIHPTTFQNNDNINAEIDNTGNVIVALQTKPPLY